MSTTKKEFLASFVTILEAADPAITPKWGKMNLQQMVEHLSVVFKISYNRIPTKIVTPAEHLPKYKEFLWSDKVFRENTKAPEGMMGEEPTPVYYASYAEAISALDKSVKSFFEYYDKNKEAVAPHPVFGMLNFDEWIQIQHKHVTHHLRQYNLITE
jgi:Protein of unknown function (DUF1569)